MEANDLKNLKVAIVVEELTQLGGAERVLDCVLEIFPKSPIYTIVFDKNKTQHRYDKFDVRPSFIQKLPFGVKKYKWYLPWMPKAVESFDLKEFDLIISITSALVKGVKTNKRQTHICICNTPTRYLWFDSKEYVKAAPIPFFIRPFMPALLKRLRKWDLKAAARPDYIIANSKNVQAKIQKYYHRDSTVIYPTIDTTKYKSGPKGDYFLLVVRLEPYKKVDLVLDAFKGLNEKLKVVGSGSKLAEFKKMNLQNVEFLGRQSDEELSKLYSGAKAFIFPQDEDFGLTPVEAMAAGTPVIAYGKGGALESVIPNQTGEFFVPQTAESLAKVIRNFRTGEYRTEVLQHQAKKFDNVVFKKEILEYIERRMNKFEAQNPKSETNPK